MARPRTLGRSAGQRDMRTGARDAGSKTHLFIAQRMLLERWERHYSAGNASTQSVQVSWNLTHVLEWFSLQYCRNSAWVRSSRRLRKIVWRNTVVKPILAGVQRVVGGEIETPRAGNWGSCLAAGVSAGSSAHYTGPDASALSMGAVVHESRHDVSRSAVWQRECSRCTRQF